MFEKYFTQDMRHNLREIAGMILGAGSKIHQSFKE